MFGLFVVYKSAGAVRREEGGASRQMLRGANGHAIPGWNFVCKTFAFFYVFCDPQHFF